LAPLAGGLPCCCCHALVSQPGCCLLLFWLHLNLRRWLYRCNSGPSFLFLGRFSTAFTSLIPAGGPQSRWSLAAIWLCLAGPQVTARAQECVPCRNFHTHRKSPRGFRLLAFPTFMLTLWGCCYVSHRYSHLLTVVDWSCPSVDCRLCC
jgi:hypothetical protein